MSDGKQTNPATVPTGTFACPICGYDEPHGHDDIVVAAYREDQIRGDGWTSTLVRTPPARGFYLCRGHKLTAHDDDLVREVIVARDEARKGGFPAEVLEFDHGFYLLHTPWIGRSMRRRAIWVQPTHWRALPAFGGVQSDAR